MVDLELSEVLALILAAGGPASQPVRVRWPLHRALRETYEASGRRGERDVLGVELEWRRSAEVGRELVGGDRALQKLVHDGVLRPVGELRQACFVLDPDAAVALRRKLMTLPAKQVDELQRAGTRWAALAATAAKNRSTASRSSAATVSSTTPKREKLAVADGA